MKAGLKKSVISIRMSGYSSQSYQRLSASFPAFMEGMNGEIKSLVSFNATVLVAQ